MSKGRFEKKGHRRSFSAKSVALMMACVLLVGCFVGGTVAWLTAQTPEVKNTFSTSNIGVQLTESNNDYKMVPGWDIAKDPKAWVKEGSEAAFLFVKVEKSANFDTFMTYEIAEGWTELESASGANFKVYYRKVATEQMGEDHAFHILEGDKVTVRDTVTKEMMTEGDFTQPTLTFTAYAHQLYKQAGEEFDPATAWNNLNPNN